MSALVLTGLLPRMKQTPLLKNIWVWEDISFGEDKPLSALVLTGLLPRMKQTPLLKYVLRSLRIHIVGR